MGWRGREGAGGAWAVHAGARCGAARGAVNRAPRPKAPDTPPLTMRQAGDPADAAPPPTPAVPFAASFAEPPPSFSRSPPSYDGVPDTHAREAALWERQERLWERELARWDAERVAWDAREAALMGAIGALQGELARVAGLQVRAPPTCKSRPRQPPRRASGNTCPRFYGAKQKRGAVREPGATATCGTAGGDQRGQEEGGQPEEQAAKRTG